MQHGILLCVWHHDDSHIHRGLCQGKIRSFVYARDGKKNYLFFYCSAIYTLLNSQNPNQCHAAIMNIAA